MIVRENFAKLLEPGLRKIWGDTYNDFETQYTHIYEVHDTDKAFEVDYLITNFGYIPEKSEGRSVDYDDIYQGWQKVYRPRLYGRGFAVTREMLEDDQYRRIAQKPKALARSCYQTIELLGASVLNNGFNNSFPGGDGVALLSNAHPLIGGGTFSNVLPTPADLSVTSFEAMLVVISKMVDERGLKIKVRPKKLLVTPEDEWMAQFILKSEKLPGTPNNNVNPAKGLIPYAVLNWLTDPDAWFITTDITNGFNFFWRRRPEFSNDTDFDSDIAKFKVTFRCDMGWTDPRCVVGSPGA